MDAHARPVLGRAVSTVSVATWRRTREPPPRHRTRSRVPALPRAGVAGAGRSRASWRRGSCPPTSRPRSGATSSSRPATPRSAPSAARCSRSTSRGCCAAGGRACSATPRCSFELFPEPDGTRLRVRHDGWDDPPVAERAGFDDGWKQKLDQDLPRVLAPPTERRPLVDEDTPDRVGRRSGTPHARRCS